MTCNANGGLPAQIKPGHGMEPASHGDTDCATQLAAVTSEFDPLVLWHRKFPGQISGSIHEAAPDDRRALTYLLSARGLTVHVHATAADYDAGALWAAAGAAHPSSIDVHMIGSKDFVDDLLRQVLAARPGRVFLPWSTFTDRRADVIRGADVRAWITLWDEWDDVSAPRWPADPRWRAGDPRTTWNAGWLHGRAASEGR